MALPTISTGQSSVTHRKFKIQITILISFLLVLIVTCGLIIYYNYERTTNLLLQEIEGKINTSIGIITRATEDQLIPAKQMTQFTGRLAENKPNILDEPNDIIHQSIMMLDLFPQISGFYNGDTKGNLLAIRRVEKDSLYPYSKDQRLPATAMYEVRTLSRNTSITKEFFQYLDAGGNVIAMAERPPATDYYDPRTRPWYMGALEKKASYWSDPYAFITTRQVGITATEPVFDSNGAVKIIMSADITMGEISTLLRKNSVGKNGITFLFNKLGLILGYPDVAKVSKKNVKGEVVMTSIQDTENPLVIEAYRLLQKNSETSFTFEQGGKSYIARFVKVGEKFDKDWTLGFIIDRGEFTGHATQTTQAMVMASFFFVILAAFLIFFISRNLARPIENVAAELKLIGEFDIDDRQPVPSHFEEIAQMNLALAAMKRSLRDFGKFVPKAVVRKLIESGEGAERGGRKMHITIMFSDIQGFSGISEKLTSEKVATYLSEYFDELTKIILEEQGTIDKYIGDAIMAFWGAPLEMQDHAYRACRSVIRCAKRLEELNHYWSMEGRPQFLTRFGVHTGDAVVGNVGSNDRLNYSAFGDDVNTASRLEGVNKAYHTYRLISHDTYKLVHHQFICRPLDIVQVVGKTEGLKIYELMDEKSTGDEAIDQQDMQRLADLCTEGFKHYLAQEFKKALVTYETVLKAFPDDPVAPIFIERCQTFIKKAPPAGWRGIYILEHK